MLGNEMKLERNHMYMEEPCEISSKGRADSLCIHNWTRHWETGKSCWGLEPGVT